MDGHRASQYCYRIAVSAAAAMSRPALRHSTVRGHHHDDGVARSFDPGGDVVTLRTDQPAHFKGVRALIVEDETLVALLLEDMLAEIGCTVVGSASTVAGAIEMLGEIGPAIVVLDINLGGEKSYPVAEVLAARGVPFVFATGYGDGRIQAPWHDRPVVQKPFGQDQLVNALSSALGKSKN